MSEWKNDHYNVGTVFKNKRLKVVYVWLELIHFETLDGIYFWKLSNLECFEKITMMTVLLLIIGQIYFQNYQKISFTKNNYESKSILSRPSIVQKLCIAKPNCIIHYFSGWKRCSSRSCSSCRKGGSVKSETEGIYSLGIKTSGMRNSSQW